MARLQQQKEEHDFVNARWGTVVAVPEMEAGKEGFALRAEGARQQLDKVEEPDLDSDDDDDCEAVIQKVVAAESKVSLNI